MISKIKKITRSLWLLALAGGVVAVIAALYPGDPARAGAPPGGPPPGPMPVNVVLAEESQAQIWTGYSGRLEAVDSVEIRPQVSGTITDVRFEDGQFVKKGDVLFVIDPAPYEAAVEKARADLATAESQNELALKQLQRAQDLAKTDAISKDLLDERQNSASVTKNAVASAKANLKQAKIDLDYAYVKAPISGRSGRAEITEGNLVQAGPNAPLLTTIVSDAEIYASFDVDEQTYLQKVRTLAQTQQNEQTIPVTLSVRGDHDRVYNGHIHSFDNRINTASGTVRARALFKNEDGTLLPGMFATVKLGGVGQETKIMIPERAVGTDQDRKFVYVVDDANKIVYREVRLGSTIDSRRVVLDGVKAGEKVVTEGLMRLRPDMVVAPQIEGQKDDQKDETKNLVPAQNAEKTE